MPAQELLTSRLRIRPLLPQDDTVIFYLRSNKDINKYVMRNTPKNMQEVHDFMEKINASVAADQSYYWAIALKETNALIGTVCFWNLSEDRSTAELGYDLHDTYHGKGYMTEALQEVLRHGFHDLKFSKVEAYTHKDNAASIKVLERLNFQFNASKKDPDNSNNSAFELKA